MGGKIIEIASSDEEKKIQRELDEKAGFQMLKRFFIGACILSVIIILIFILAHPWKFTIYADSTQWGQYGDFIGGFIGTFIGFMSVYYLIKTLREQILANQKVSENNLATTNVNFLQQTDTKIRYLIEFYKEIRESYDKRIPSNKTLNEYVIILKNKKIKSQDNYKNRLMASKEVFEEEFYIPCKPVAAVQFRVLYQIMCLIQTIDEKKNRDIKLFYGKMVRSQLSEDELLLLRYNCQCKYGKAMRLHINRFNLLKHLPPLSLLEFQYWREEVLRDELLQNAMDTELIAERKLIREITHKAMPNLMFNGKIIPISTKYSLCMTLSENRLEFIYCLKRAECIGDGERIDEAFSKLGNNHTLNFIKDFLHEVFEYSNFQRYNEDLEYLPLDSNPEYNSDTNETIFRVVVKSNNGMEIVTNYDDYLEIAPKKENDKVHNVII